MKTAFLIDFKNGGIKTKEFIEDDLYEEKQDYISLSCSFNGCKSNAFIWLTGSHSSLQIPMIQIR